MGIIASQLLRHCAAPQSQRVLTDIFQKELLMDILYNHDSWCIFFDSDCTMTHAWNRAAHLAFSTLCSRRFRFDAQNASLASCASVASLSSPTSLASDELPPLERRRDGFDFCFTKTGGTSGRASTRVLRRAVCAANLFSMDSN